MDVDYIQFFSRRGAPAQFVRSLRSGDEDVSALHVAGQPNAANLAFLELRRTGNDARDQRLCRGGHEKPVYNHGKSVTPHKKTRSFSRCAVREHLAAHISGKSLGGGMFRGFHSGDGRADKMAVVLRKVRCEKDMVVRIADLRFTNRQVYFALGVTARGIVLRLSYSCGKTVRSPLLLKSVAKITG